MMTDMIVRSVLNFLTISYFIVLSGSKIILVYDVASYVCTLTNWLCDILIMYVASLLKS